MPTVLTEAPSPSERKRWTRADRAVLEATEVLDQRDRELLEGDLIDRGPKYRPHSNALAWLRLWLQEVFGWKFVSTEVPIDVAPQDNPTSEPEPDIIVLKRAFSTFRTVNPGPPDLHLIVEIADSTLATDLKTKAALYARAGIPDYWVLDVNGRRLMVHREPHFGKYTEIAIYTEQESVAPLAAPHARFAIAYAFQEE